MIKGRILRTKNQEQMSVQVISTQDQISAMAQEWNVLVGQSIENPFLLSPFVTQMIKSNYLNNYFPLVLVFSVKKEVIGIAPLKAMKHFGILAVEPINKSFYSPDLIVKSHYRQIFVTGFFDYLFETLNCKFADLYLPTESPNLQVIQQQCKDRRIHFNKTFEMGHRILQIKCTWDEFQSIQGKNFRQQFKKVAKKLDRAGTWKTICVDGEDVASDIEKLFEVEKRSWKQTWRSQRGDSIDEDLKNVIEAAEKTGKIEPGFKWKVWYLELNNQTIAYLLVLLYRDKAYFTKTSYDQNYGSFYPGKFLNNSVIGDLFNEGQVKTIDFLTDLPFHRTWTPICKQRIAIKMAKGVVPILARAKFTEAFLIKTQKVLPNKMTMQNKTV